MAEKEAIERLEERLAGLDDLPTMPAVVSRVTAMMGDPNTTVEGLAKVISQDQVTSTRVLRLANSAYYGFPQEINTVRRAVVLLGFRELRNLVVTASMLQTFRSRVASTFPAAFWRHSLAAAVAAKSLGKALNYPDPEELFVIGLLHDIGKMVLMVAERELFLNIMSEVKKGEVSFHEVEARLAGFTHCDVGRIVLETWNFPSSIIEAVQGHHEPAVGDSGLSESMAAHLGDILARALSLGSGGDRFVPPIEKAARKPLTSIPGSIKELMIEVREEFDRAESFLELVEHA